MYERAYRATEGAKYIERLYYKYRLRYLGERAAQIYERAGHDKEALRLYHNLLRSAPQDITLLLNVVRLEIRFNRQQQALDLLKPHQERAGKDELVYWQTLGDLAWLLQDMPTATNAYRYLALTPGATARERTRVFNLMLLSEPAQAADLALRFYRLSNNAAWVKRALEIHVGLEQWQAAREVLGELRGNTPSSLQQESRFFVLRSQVAAHFNHNRDAARDMLRAIALEPGDDDLLISALWLFSAVGDRKLLRQLIDEVPRPAPSLYWRVLAVACREIGAETEALAYYRRLLQREPENPLLLLEYADLLQSNHNAKSAQAIRSELWLRLQNSTASKSEEVNNLHARLLLLNQPGDHAAQLVRRLHQGSKGVPPLTTSQRDTLLLSWAIESGWRESARAWARRHYGGSNEPLPKWAALYMALETQDSATLQTLLENDGNDLPVDNAYDAALALGRWPLAQKIAFDGMQQNPNSDALQQRLTEVSQQYADRLALQYQNARYDTFDNDSYSLALEQAITETLRWGIDWRDIRQRLSSSSILQTIPDRDTRVQLHSEWRTDKQQWRLSLDSHDELTRYTGWQLDTTQQLTQRVQWSAAVTSRRSISHTAPLEVAAHADGLQLGLDYSLERRLLLSLSAASERYHTQYDAYLGSGLLTGWQATYRIREDYPDWSVRLSGDHYRFSADGEPDSSSMSLFDPAEVGALSAAQRATLFVPGDGDYYSLCNSSGIALRDKGSRILRPFGELCAIHSTQNGDGYSLLVGLAGSIGGGDHLNLTLEQSDAAIQTDNRNTQIITVSYQLIF